MLRKVLSIIIIASMIASFMLTNVAAFAAGGGSEPLVAYVSTFGRTGAAGSFSDPFPNIQEALDFLSGKTSSESRGAIYVRGGEYLIADMESIELSAANSFTTITAYGSEEVLLTGLITLDNSKFMKLTDPANASKLASPNFSSNVRLTDSAARDNIWVYDLAADGIGTGDVLKNGMNWLAQPYAPDLVVDGNVETLARYPNQYNELGVERVLSGDMTMLTLLTGKIKGSGTNQWGGDDRESNPRPGSGLPRELWDLANNAGADKGAYVRNFNFDKIDMYGISEVLSYQDLLRLPGPIYYVTGHEYENETRNPGGFSGTPWYPLIDRYEKWGAPYDPAEPDPFKPLATFPYSRDNEIQTEPHMNANNTLYETDGWLKGLLESDFGFDMVKIYSIDAAKQIIHTKYPGIQGTQDIRSRLIGYNILCEIDSEGEYYIDRYQSVPGVKNDVLYYYPENGAITDQVITIMGTTTPLMIINDGEDIVVKGIKFTGTSSNAIEMYNCESCVITDCEIYNISGDAIRIGRNNDCITTDPMFEAFDAGHNNAIRNSYIHHTGSGGVYLAGGNLKSLERGNNVVENCDFYKISLYRLYAPAAYMDGFGNTFRNNYVEDARQITIQIMGGDMLIDHNKFINCAWYADDTGVIYAGRSWTWLGNVISNNLFESYNGRNPNGTTTQGYGIYLDDGMAGIFIRNNIFKGFKRRVVFSNEGFANSVQNTVCIDIGTWNAAGTTFTSGELMAFNAKAVNSARPMANEKVYQYRWYDIFRKEGEPFGFIYGTPTPAIEARFCNTEENIEKWLEHYSKMYPSFADWYYPQAGATNAEIWQNANSTFVSSFHTLDHTIAVTASNLAGTAIGQNNTTNTFNNASTGFYRTNADVLKFNDVAALGLDLATGKFDPDTPLNNNPNYGEAWVDEWNATFSLDNIGRTSSGLSSIFKLEGPASVTSGAGQTATYTIKAENMPMASAIDFEIEVNGDFLSSNTFLPENGFAFFSSGNYNTPLNWRKEGSKWIGKAILYNAAGGTNGDYDVINLVFNVAEGEIGYTDVKLNYVIASFEGNPVASFISNDTVITLLEKWYSPYDLNKDDFIDLNDLTFALQFLLVTPDDQEAWEQAKVCDFNNDKIIDIEDLIEILANYTVPYYS